ncbi:unnamed protein product [Peronospora farinosa]|uniref:Transmembrane protein 70 n=1 Tax=Peronospora farinosa TaxID=134698 RepID=A0AAV0U122_9STRA|nr:unnamed protein product [Peronospora farinosa]CAI5730302.1 unnamed protein product [Peronospora farinosa]
MSVLRLSCRAVRLAKTFPASIRSLYTISHIKPNRRFVNVSSFQRLAFDSNSHFQTSLFPASFAVHHFSSSRSNKDAQKTHDAVVDKITLPDSSLIGYQVYSAPMSRAVRLMKAVSVTSCVLTSIGMPVLCMVSEQDTSTIGKWAMCGTIMLFGLGSTSLFHYLFKPYVMRMWLADSLAADGTGGEAIDDPMVTVETVTLFAQLTKNSFRLSEVSPPAQTMHPMVSFQARDRHYFIHPETFEDRNLLKKLVGAGKRK